MPTRKTFLGTLLVVFVLHLAPVSSIAILLLTDSLKEAEIWFLFLFIDFPTSWLAFPVTYVIDISGLFDGSYQQELANVIFPAVFFQFSGVINWMLIIYGLRYLFVRVRRVRIRRASESARTMVSEQATSEP